MRAHSALGRTLVFVIGLGWFQVASTILGCVGANCWVNQLDRWAVAFVGIAVGGVLSLRDHLRWGAICSLIGAAYAEGILERAGGSLVVVSPALVVVLWLVALTAPEKARGPVRLLGIAGMAVSAAAAAIGIMTADYDWRVGGLLGVMALAVIAGRTAHQWLSLPRVSMGVIALAPIGLHLSLHSVQGYSMASAAAVPLLNSYLALGMLGLLVVGRREPISGDLAAGRTTT